MLQAKITAIQDEQATIVLPDGQTIRVPVKEVEGKPAEGLSVYLLLALPGAEDAARQKLAKHLLNELMQ